MKGAGTMKNTVTAQEIQAALESKIGNELASSPDFTGTVARFLNEWTFHPDDLAVFSEQLENLIFQEIYARLGRGMRYRSRDGRLIRIYSEDLPDLADRCLALLLPRCAPSAEAWTVLQPMAFDRGSYAAMLTLYRSYGNMLGEANLGFIAGILAERARAEGLPKLLYP